jgi:hypothetical protein
MPPPNISYNPSLLLGVQDEEMCPLFGTNFTRFSPIFTRSMKLVVTKPWYQLIVCTRSLWRSWNSKTSSITELPVLLIMFMSMGWDYVSELRPLAGLLFIPRVIYEHGATVKWCRQKKSWFVHQSALAFLPVE